MKDKKTIVRIEDAKNVTVELPIEDRAIIRLRIGERLVAVPLAIGLFTTFKTKFMRKQPTDNQREVHGMVMSMMAAAYFKGLEDGAQAVLDRDVPNEAKE